MFYIYMGKTVKRNYSCACRCSSLYYFYDISYVHFLILYLHTILMQKYKNKKSKLFYYSSFALPQQTSTHDIHFGRQCVRLIMTTIFLYEIEITWSLCLWVNDTIFLVDVIRWVEWLNLSRNLMFLYQKDQIRSKPIISFNRIKTRIFFCETPHSTLPRFFSIKFEFYDYISHFIVMV